jgi:hypothetical protein
VDAILTYVLAVCTEQMVRCEVSEDGRGEHDSGCLHIAG